MRSAWIASALAVVTFGQNPDPLFWGRLKPGRNTVGYRSYFEMDSTRRFGGFGTVRPVLVNMWYPSEGDGSDPLPYGDYLKVPPLPQYPSFVSNLERFLLDALSEDLFLKKRIKLNAKERRFIQALLLKPTIAHRALNPPKGNFRLFCTTPELRARSRKTLSCVSTLRVTGMP